MAKPRDISGVEPRLFREKEPSLKILHHRNGSVRGYEKPPTVPEPSVRKAGERFGRHPLPSFLKEKRDTPQIGTLAPVPIVVLDTEAVDMAKLHEFSAPTSQDATSEDAPTSEDATDTTEPAPDTQPPEPTPAQAETQALVEAVVHKREVGSTETETEPDTEIDSDTQELLRSVERRFWRRVGAFLLLSLGLAVGVGVLFIAMRARRDADAAPARVPGETAAEARDSTTVPLAPKPKPTETEPTNEAATGPVAADSPVHERVEQAATTTAITDRASAARVDRADEAEAIAPPRQPKMAAATKEKRGEPVTNAAVVSSDPSVGVTPSSSSAADTSSEPPPATRRSPYSRTRNF